LYLPKIGLVKAVFHREIEGTIKTVTISSEAGQYFASINYEDGIERVVGTNNGKSIGVDV
jgi:putative transposase